MTSRIVNVPPLFLARTLYPRVTVAEYHQMIADGVFEDGAPIELIEGYLVRKTPYNPLCANTLTKLNKWLVLLDLADWVVQSKLPITLADSEPEPDAALARGDETTFADHHPEPAEVGLVIEVADSSRYADRTEKLRMYARAGIAVYWIVNVSDKQVEVYTDPDRTADPPVYRARTDYKPGASVPIVLDGTAVAHLAVSELVS